MKTNIGRFRAVANRRAHQRGFTLIVALLLLVALTIVGVASIRNVTLQQKMTNNLYFRAVAFNEASATLTFSGQSLLASYGTAASGPVACSASNPRNFCVKAGGGGLNYLGEDTTWSSSVSVATPLNSGFVSNWYTENFEGVVVEDGCEKTSTNPNVCDRTYYRQTARGVEPASGAFAVTQQYFRILGSATN
jgi:type IV pilus assembly protein PilX